MSKKTKKNTVDPKKRMKEIRHIVSKAVSKNIRIDEMDFTSSDVDRVIIALQDLLNNSIDRHKKASEHILKLKKHIGDEQNYFFNTIHDYRKNLSEKTVYAEEILGLLVREREDHMSTAEKLQKSFEENQKLKDELVILNVKLGSSLTTLRTVMDEGVL